MICVNFILFGFGVNVSCTEGAVVFGFSLDLLQLYVCSYSGGVCVRYYQIRLISVLALGKAEGGFYSQDRIDTRRGNCGSFWRLVYKVRAFQHRDPLAVVFLCYIPYCFLVASQIHTERR